MSQSDTHATGERPWTSILSVLAITRFSDWLASRAAPQEQPDGTAARPTLTARVLQTVSRAGGAMAVTAVLAQAKNRNRRLAAIRTAIGVPGSTAAESSVESSAKPSGSRQTSPVPVMPAMAARTDSPGGRSGTMPGAGKASRPDSPMQAATQSVDALVDTLQGASSDTPAAEIRDQVADTITALEAAKRSPAGTQQEAVSPVSSVGNGTRIASGDATHATPGIPQRLKSIVSAPVRRQADQVDTATASQPRRIGRVASAVARAKAFASGQFLLNTSQAASLLKLTPDEFSQLHAQQRVAGHVADTASGPLFDSGFMRPDQGVRSTAIPPALESIQGLSSEFDTAQSLGVSPGRLKALRESGTVQPLMDDSAGIARYQYSSDDRRALESLIPQRRVNSGATASPVATVSHAQHVAAPSVASTPAQAVRSQQPVETTLPDIQVSDPPVQARRPGLFARMRQSVARRFGGHHVTTPTPAQAVRVAGTGKPAGLVAQQIENRRQPEPVNPSVVAAKTFAARWLGPVASRAAGVAVDRTQHSAHSTAANTTGSASPGVTSTASVPPAASAGSRPSAHGGDGGHGGDDSAQSPESRSDGSRPATPASGGNGGNGGSHQPPRPPMPPDDDDEESERIRRRQQEREQERHSGGSRRRMFTAEQINAIPSIHLRRMAHRANALTSIPRPSRKMRVMTRRRARQALSAASRTRVGAGVMRTAGRFAPLAGQAVAAGIGPAGGAMGGAAGIAGGVMGGAALAAGFAGLAVLLTGTVMLSLKGFADRINESNRHLSQYNGTIAGAFGQLDVGRHHRGIETGHDTQGTTVELASKINEMEEALQPLNAAWTNVTNTMAGLGADIVTGVATGVTTAIEAFLPEFKKGDEADGKRPAWAEGIIKAYPMLEAAVNLLTSLDASNKEIEEEMKKKDGIGPLGLQTLQRLENPNFQQANKKGELPPGPLPALWEPMP